MNKLQHQVDIKKCFIGLPKRCNILIFLTDKTEGFKKQNKTKQKHPNFLLWELLKQFFWNYQTIFVIFLFFFQSGLDKELDGMRCTHRHATFCHVIHHIENMIYTYPSIPCLLFENTKLGYELWDAYLYYFTWDGRLPKW